MKNQKSYPATSNQYPSLNFDAINELCSQSCLNPAQLLHELGLGHLKEAGKKWSGVCGVHDGDNQSAFNFYPDGEYVPGYWVCRTHHCEQKYGKNLIGLIKGVKKCGFGQALKWLLEYNGLKDLNQVKLPENDLLQKRKQNRIFSKLNVIPSALNNNTIKWDRSFVRRVLEIPSEYYKKRGYKPEILDKYDVGYYNRIDRVSVPIYDSDYNFCVGFTARSIYDKCSKCSLYHNPNKDCPKTEQEICNSFKWKNSKDFECGQHLYNYWFAKNEIISSSVAILVEGPGDVWRLEEQGIKNSVALFGCDIKEYQRVILDGSGALSLIVMLDNDEAGIKGAKILKQKLGRTYRMFFPKINSKDVGDLNSDFITKEIEPIIRRFKNG